MKNKTFYTLISQIMINFATVITKIDRLRKIGKKLIRFLKSKGVHSLIIPFLHAALWAAGLYCTIEAEGIFHNNSSDEIEIIKFLTIFVVLFLEVMIVLLDLYVSQKANYISPIFILFVIVLLISIVGTAISAGFAFAPNGNSILPLIWVLAFSSLLKFIENLLVNNLDWYIIKIPKIFDARGFYINRELA
jgi:hypothetical protein